jgi:uncharacterized membrane-anchored protein
VSGVIIALFAVSYATAVFLAIGSLIEVASGIPYRTSIMVFTIIVAVYLLEVAIPLSFLLTWLLSLITKPLPEKLVDKAFKNIYNI